MIRKLYLAGSLATATALAAPTCAQELYLLHSGPSPSLERIDGPTGQVLGELPILGATYLGRGLAIRWDGMLFTTDHLGKDDDRLFKIHPATGQGEVIGVPLPTYMLTLAADPNTGRLYGTSDKDLYRIDHKTGDSVLIGQVHADGMFGGPMAMAIGRDGMGYVTDRGYIGLYKVDLETAETTFVCFLGSQVWYEDMAFDSDGMLWAIMAWDGMVRRSDILNCHVEPLYEHYAIGIEVVPEGDGCYSDCNLDGALDLFDFLCFVNAFNAGDDKADCTGDHDLSLFDFLCFVNSFNAGC